MSILANWQFLFYNYEISIKAVIYNDNNPEVCL